MFLLLFSGWVCAQQTPDASNGSSYNQPSSNVSSNYVEDRLFRLMTEVAEGRHTLACATSESRGQGAANYCFNLSQSINRRSNSNRRELILNYIDRIFPSARFAAECRANVDHVFELLDDHPWPPVNCEDSDPYCANTLEHAFGTNQPEAIEGALIAKLETCHYNGPSTLPF